MTTQTVGQFAKDVGIARGNYYVFIEEGMPKMPDVDGAKKWVAENKKQRGLGPPDKTNNDRREVPDSGHGDEWDDRLVRARQTERETHKAYMESLALGEAGKLEKLLSCHSRAVQAVGEAEQIAFKVRKDTGELATRDEFRAVMKTVLEPIRQALDGLAKGEASRCNPTMPDVARTTLEAWRDKLLVRIQGLEVKL